jgi:hypothetical protein
MSQPWDRAERTQTQLLGTKLGRQLDHGKAEDLAAEAE